MRAEKWRWYRLHDAPSGSWLLVKITEIVVMKVTVSPMKGYKRETWTTTFYVGLWKVSLKKKKIVEREMLKISSRGATVAIKWLQRRKLNQFLFFGEDASVIQWPFLEDSFVIPFNLWLYCILYGLIRLIEKHPQKTDLDTGGI